MNPFVLYLLWGALLLGSVLWSALLFKRQPRPVGAMAKAALIVPLVSAIISFWTFVCFTLVFLVGGSSNVAQFAQPDGMNWWSFWFSWFRPLLAANLLLLLVSGVFVFLPPYSPKQWQSTLCRLMACAGVLLSLSHLFGYAPDA